MDGECKFKESVKLKNVKKESVNWNSLRHNVALISGHTRCVMQGKWCLEYLDDVAAQRKWKKKKSKKKIETKKDQNSTNLFDNLLSKLIWWKYCVRDDNRPFRGRRKKCSLAPCLFLIFYPNIERSLETSYHFFNNFASHKHVLMLIADDCTHVVRKYENFSSVVSVNGYYGMGPHEHSDILLD